jgi:bifunctional ADP-heptose synthase (sugar kinase/adenylyltransferase)
MTNTRSMISSERLEELLNRFPRQAVGLVGDLFLDRYLHIPAGVHELSLETGLEAYQVARMRNSPGALGTVINNLAALGVGKLVPVTVIGDDGHGFDLLETLKPLPVELQFVIRDPQRLTPTYTKPLLEDAAGVWRELHRLDIRTRGPLDPRTAARVEDHVRRVFAETDGLIVLDQVSEEGWGVVGPELRATLAELATRWPDKLMFVDSRCHLGAFTRGMLKGNGREVLCAVGGEELADSPHDAARHLASRTGNPVFVTLGADGILVTHPDGQQHHAHGIPVDGPIDIVGAGDAATSGIVAALLAGASECEAAIVGNLAASITIQQLGTTGSASPAQLRSRREEAHHGFRGSHG